MSDFELPLLDEELGGREGVAIMCCGVVECEKDRLGQFYDLKGRWQHDGHARPRRERWKIAANALFCSSRVLR